MIKSPTGTLTIINRDEPLTDNATKAIQVWFSETEPELTNGNRYTMLADGKPITLEYHHLPPSA